jgi:hypothetical protein
MTTEEQVEDDAFNDTMKHLEVMSAQDGFDIRQVDAEMDSLQKYEGLDWVGRGELKAAELAGTLLAYQAFLMRYRKREDAAG